MKEFNDFLGEKGLLAFFIIFLILGLISLVWLIVYQEADPDKTFRGSVARAFAASMFLGLSIFMFITMQGLFF
ncbi:MAG: hypothetical protein ACTSO7_01865 [Candidatus Heimdallarchaeota archaeon]